MSTSSLPGKPCSNGAACGMELNREPWCGEAAGDAPPRRPSRKKFDEEMEGLTSTIKAKEAELRNLQSSADTFEQEQQTTSPAGSSAAGGSFPAPSSATTVWEERDETISRRRAIDERLQAANKEIANKRDAVARIHSTLNYKSEDRINEAIKRLEYQLRVNNFKVNEEKRIVKEIDNLNRSRRNLKEYLDRKCELDSLMKEQQEMRSERDALFRAVTELTQKGEKLKRETRERKAIAETIKKELDDLYAEKRQLAATYRQSFSKFQHHRAQLKRLTMKKEDNNEKEEVENVQQESFLEERQLCATLLSYLQRFEFSQVSSALTPSLGPQDYLGVLQLPASEGNTPVSPSEDVRLLRRKEENGDENWCVCTSGRGTRARRNNTKKLRQQQKKKRITHTPEVFEQFSRVQLSAPSLLSEVPVAIEQLKAKKKFYDHLSQAGHLHEIPELPLYSLSSPSVDAKKPDIIPDPVVEPPHDSFAKLEVQFKEERKESMKPPLISTNSVTKMNSVPKTLDLGLNTYSTGHMNGYENGLDDLDMGYSSENGYTKFESKERLVQPVQTIEL